MGYLSRYENLMGLFATLKFCVAFTHSVKFQCVGCGNFKKAKPDRAKFHIGVRAARYLRGKI